MLNRILIFLSFSIIGSTAFSQIGGKNSFEFVDMAVNAHTAGIGGLNVSVKDHDINMIFQNPSLLNENMFNNLSLSYLPYFAGIHATSTAYGKDFGKYGKYGFGLQYLNYGKIMSTDPSGADLGFFMPQEYVFLVSTSHSIDNFTLGGSLKLAGSVIEDYSSYAVMTDVGGLFKHPSRDFTVGLVVKNLGFAFKKYTPESKVAMPFDVQVGTSYKLEHMPLRMSLTAHHLHQFDIVYLDPTKKGVVDLEGNEVKEKKTFADKLARHFVVGGEFIISKNFNLRFGYNYLRRKELRLQTKSGGAGFSFGFMMRIKSFELAYSYANYHAAGGANYITVATNFNALIKKKEKKISKEDRNND